MCTSKSPLLLAPTPGSDGTLIQTRFLSAALVLSLLFCASTRAYAATVTLPTGTPIPLVLVENINANINVVGETVKLKVATNVVVDGEVVVPKGALVIAKVGLAQKRKSLGKAGTLEFFPVRAQTIDGQWVSLEKDNFGAQGRTRTGATIGHVIAWGPLGLFAKGRAAYALRGLEYEATVAQDRTIDTEKVEPLPSVKEAAFRTSAKFGAVSTVKFSKGKRGKDIVLEVALTPEIASLVREDPSAVEIVEVLNDVLHKPIHPVAVEVDRANSLLKASFDWWSIIKHSLPDQTPMTVQLTLSNGQLAQAPATLESKWKIK